MTRRGGASAEESRSRTVSREPAAPATPRSPDNQTSFIPESAFDRSFTAQQASVSLADLHHGRVVSPTRPSSAARLLHASKHLPPPAVRQSLAIRVPTPRAVEDILNQVSCEKEKEEERDICLWVCVLSFKSL